MGGVLFVGCGRTATEIATRLVDIPSIGKFYLNSRIGVGANRLEQLLRGNGKEDVKVVSSPSDAESPSYVIITLTNMPDEVWWADVRTARTTTEIRLNEVLYNFAPMMMLGEQLRKFNEATILVVTNPVDYFTNYFRTFFALENVYGFGLELDAERYKRFLFSDRNAERPMCAGIHGDAFPLTGWGEGVLYGDLYRRVDEKLLKSARGSGIPYDFCGEMFKSFFLRFTGEKEDAVMLSVPLVGYQGIDGVCMSVPVLVRNGCVNGYAPVKFNDAENVRLHTINERLSVALGGMERMHSAFKRMSGY